MLSGAEGHTGIKHDGNSAAFGDFLPRWNSDQAAADFLNAKYGEGTVELQLRDSYFNMKKCIEPVMYVVDRARAAMERLGITPYSVPVRGGTDGAKLSYMGLPCPNLCTGGENYHGRFEYIPVEDMEKCVDMLVEIVSNF